MMKRILTGLSTLLAGCAISHVGAEDAVSDVAVADTPPHDFRAPSATAGLAGSMPGRLVGAALCIGAAGCSATHNPPAAVQAPLLGEWSQQQQGCGPDYTTFLTFADDGTLVMRGVMEDFDGGEPTEQERAEGTWELEGGVLTWRYLVGEREVETQRVLAVLDSEPFGDTSEAGQWWSHTALARVDGAYTQRDWAGTRSLAFDRPLDALGECRVAVASAAVGDEGALGEESFELGCRVVDSEARPGLWEVEIDLEDAPSLEEEERTLANALGSLRPQARYRVDPAQPDVLVPEFASPEYDGFVRAP